jgi:trehalose 6-phosphate phosphatase
MTTTHASLAKHAARLAAQANQVALCLDFDGTLSPIVDDPGRAVIHPDGPATLRDLAAQVRAVAIITGRPARQVVELGRLDAVADEAPDDARLVVMGQYGNERWNSRTREFVSPEPLPALLAEHQAKDAYVEEKCLAVAVHTRRLPDAQAAVQRLEHAFAGAVEKYGLALEPGRLVLEVRAPGMHKGRAVRTAVEEHQAGGVLFAGDDLGDLEAFRAVRDLAGDGLPTLLVCSASEEQEALTELSDVVVDGPAGVLRLLATFAADAAARRAD